MHNITMTGCDGVVYRRITKTKARNTFVNLGIAFAAPVNANLASPWIGRPFMIRYDESDYLPRPERFEVWTSMVEAYNCDSELGRYLAFYEVVA